MEDDGTGEILGHDRVYKLGKQSVSQVSYILVDELVKLRPRNKNRRSSVDESYIKLQYIIILVVSELETVC